MDKELRKYSSSYISVDTYQPHIGKNSYRIRISFKSPTQWNYVISDGYRNKILTPSFTLPGKIIKVTKVEFNESGYEEQVWSQDDEKAKEFLSQPLYDIVEQLIS